MQHIALSHELLDSIENDALIPVLLESPLASDTIEGIVRNKKYARACMRDSLGRGEAPYASHLLFAQEGILDDDVPDERALGIHAGLVWGAFAGKTVVYTDLGISGGMHKGIERAKKEGRDVEERTLGFIPEVSEKETALEKLRRDVELDLKNENAETGKTIGRTQPKQKR